MRQETNSKEFTLIELLVVIAFLIVLLLPTIQQAIETTRKHSCRTNLEQIGLTFYNYLETYKVFPPGYIQTSQSNRN
ncbi:hypothetical protein V202x_34430 [Gimesia aquarii]|uniref:DUF1559 domain-containing protein n=1 Tax=Gimesia aquarii TaxID=2527964 RepID=A0A517WXR3_9PLAN|nr:hypothetical protein V202x_34430 [Gimesia aquarii]